MPHIDVCFTPETVNLYDFSEKNVVVIDIFRATTTMVAGLASGLETIIPVSDLEECQAFPDGSSIIKAAERGGQKVDGFEYGNSPYDYINGDVKGKTLIMTTTNGTLAISLSHAASNILIGAFINISAVADFLVKDNKDVVLFCAGWKGMYNLEDSLFAGALIHRLQNHFHFESDGALSVCLLYEKAKFDGFMKFLKNSSHFKRLSGFNNMNDIELALKFDQFDVLPMMKGDRLMLA